MQARNAEPDNDPNFSYNWNQKPVDLMSRRIECSFSYDMCYDQWKNNDCYCCFRASYEEDGDFIASAKWTPVILFTLHDTFATIFAKEVLLTG